ncbi:hypothetical protein ARTTLWGJ_CDS0128 [Staphylococcus phage PG-2021_35]
MKKKPQGNEIIITIITVMVAIFVVITTIFFNKYQDAKEDKDKYQRIVEIYQKADDNNGDTKKKYVKRLNEAEEELRKVKKETNYKGYNEKSKKERQKEDKKTRDKIYDVTGDDDLILVKNNIEFSDKVGKPEILISEDGVGTITVPTNSGYEKQTVGSIITSVLGSPYLSQYSPSTDSLGIIDSNVYPNTANSISEGINASNDNVPTDNSIITNPVEPGIPSDALPGNTVDNNSGDVDNTDNPNPPPPGYTDADGGKGSGGGGSIEPPPPIEEPSDNGNTEGNEGEVTPEPEPSEPGTEQPNEKPDEGNDNEEEPSEPSDNPDDNEEEPSENPNENEVEEPSEPDDKADEEDTNEDTSEDEQTTEQPEEQPDDNTTDNEDKIEEE